MKKYFLLIAAFYISINTSAQIWKLEENPNWEKYKTIKERTKKGDKNYWNYVYQLKEGNAYSINSFYGNEWRGTYTLGYDEKLNLKSLKLVGSNNDEKDSIIDFELKYNELGLKSEDKNAKYVYDTSSRLIKSFTKSFEYSNGREGWSENYFYDGLGNLIRLEKTTFNKNKNQIDTEDYIYDDCKNIIQVSRNSSPERAYPIVVIGGELKNKIDFYEYEYNSDCIWTKKYKKVDGKMKLVSERELIAI